ncbi:MAG: serine/threonine protein kinase [Planctomycetaceae bacterium]|nr:serine/threonine protein kinase [Planctomycetaceae bacterium]
MTRRKGPETLFQTARCRMVFTIVRKNGILIPVVFFGPRCRARQANSFMPQPAGEQERPNESTVIQPSPTFTAEKWDQIGDFRIERRLGAGGMGIVYQARQLSLNRLVALKVLGSALNRPSDIVRFKREAQAIARLHHPGIAEVYFIGQDSQLSYIALEFIDGPPLRRVIDRLRSARNVELTLDNAVRESVSQPEVGSPQRFDEPTQEFVKASTDPKSKQPQVLSPEVLQLAGREQHIRRCCELVRDAALALAHAHEHGVVHRDIKPENLLLDQECRIHIVDFGLARFYEDVTVTQTGQLVGTPMYMSPEQVSGRVDVDHRTDIYSMGLVLYELLALCRPIVASTREEVLRQIVTKPLLPVSWRNSGVANDLEAVVHKATARDPDERYSTATEFAADLQRILDRQPVQARPYRYALDEREIVAARPKPMITFAFAFFVCGIASLMQVPFGIYYSASVWDVAVTTGYLALGIASFPIGFGLLSARPWARSLGIAAFFSFGCLSSALSVWVVHVAMRIEERTGQIFVGVAFFAICAAAGFGACAMLYRARKWFHFAQQVRNEEVARKPG